MRFVDSSLSDVCAAAHSVVVLRVFPRLAWQLLQGRVQWSEDGGVLGVIFESLRYGLYVAREACKDVDGSLSDDGIGYDGTPGDVGSAHDRLFEVVRYD